MYRAMLIGCDASPLMNNLRSAKHALRLENLNSLTLDRGGELRVLGEKWEKGTGGPTRRSESCLLVPEASLFLFLISLTRPSLAIRLTTTTNRLRGKI